MAQRVRWSDGTDRLFVTPEEEKFLSKHRIGLDKVFDATGLKRREYGPVMKERGYIVAGGVTICIRGHQLRDRFGHCAQCNPQSLVYASRFQKVQCVYVAHSKAGRLIKIGTSGDLSDRFEQLNIHQYGGYADWVMLDAVHCEAAGRVEKDLQVALRRYQVTGSYGARPEDCRELFRCRPSIALAALRRIQQKV